MTCTCGYCTSFDAYRAAQARYWTAQAAKQTTFNAALICLSKAARYRRKVDA
jgi:hypothetical protein